MKQYTAVITCEFGNNVVHHIATCVKILSRVTLKSTFIQVHRFIIRHALQLSVKKLVMSFQTAGIPRE